MRIKRITMSIDCRELVLLKEKYGFFRNQVIPHFNSGTGWALFSNPVSLTVIWQRFTLPPRRLPRPLPLDRE